MTRRLRGETRERARSLRNALAGFRHGLEEVAVALREKAEKSRLQGFAALRRRVVSQRQERDRDTARMLERARQRQAGMRRELEAMSRHWRALAGAMAARRARAG